VLWFIHYGVTCHFNNYNVHSLLNNLWRIDSIFFPETLPQTLSDCHSGFLINCSPTKEVSICPVSSLLLILFTLPFQIREGGGAFMPNTNYMKKNLTMIREGTW
jgi:hypothetical protein